MFTGVIIEESLEDRTVLQRFPILKTEVEQVTEKFGTPWLTEWHLHTMEIPDEQIEEFAKEIERAIDTEHQNSWFADFHNDTTHYIIFKNRTFKVDRTKDEDYDAAASHGVSIGIPGHQLTFSEWRPK